MESGPVSRVLCPGEAPRPPAAGGGHSSGVSPCGLASARPTREHARGPQAGPGPSPQTTRAADLQTFCQPTPPAADPPIWVGPWGGRAQRSPIWPCSGRGLASRRVAAPLVGSYPTISPLPAPQPAPGAPRGAELAVPGSRVCGHPAAAEAHQPRRRAGAPWQAPRPPGSGRRGIRGDRPCRGPAPEAARPAELFSARRHRCCTRPGRRLRRLRPCTCARGLRPGIGVPSYLPLAPAALQRGPRPSLSDALTSSRLRLAARAGPCGGRHCLCLLPGLGRCAAPCSGSVPASDRSVPARHLRSLRHAC